MKLLIIGTNGFAVVESHLMPPAPEYDIAIESRELSLDYQGGVYAV